MPKRIEWIDTARGLGLLLVFIGHLKPPYISTWIYTCHMPLFFFLSGLVFSMHPLREFISKKFLRLIVPYFCLGIVIYLFWTCIYIYEQRPAHDYFEMLVNLLEQKAFWTIWFLAALFLADIIVWIELKICKCHIIWTLQLSIIIMTSMFMYYRIGGTTLPWCIDVACVAQFFVLLGYIFRNNFSKIKIKTSKYILIPLAMIINIVCGFLSIRFSGNGLDMSVGIYGNEVLTIISAISGIAAIVMLCMVYSNSFLRYLGQNTMIFFAWHSRIIIVACGMIYGVLGIFQDQSLVSQILYTLTTLILIIAALTPVTNIIKKSKVSHYFGL